MGNNIDSNIIDKIWQIVKARDSRCMFKHNENFNVFCAKMQLSIDQDLNIS